MMPSVARYCPNPKCHHGWIGTCDRERMERSGRRPETNAEVLQNEKERNNLKVSLSKAVLMTKQRTMLTTNAVNFPFTFWFVTTR